jgi:hypothetical protein
MLVYSLVKGVFDMGKRETKIMIPNIDVKLLSEYFSETYNCSRKDALMIIKTVILRSALESTNDYDVLYTLCEEPTQKMVTAR